jgi:hypothetical protein
MSEKAKLCDGEQRLLPEAARLRRLTRASERQRQSPKPI